MTQKKIIDLSRSLIVITCSLFFFIPFSHSQDVFVSLGNGSGAPKSQQNRIMVALENTVPLRGLQLAILDEKDYLTATGCSTMGRASTFTCDINEKQYGWTELLLYSFGGDLIQQGSGPILSINYAVKGNAPPEECVPLRILYKARTFESKASDENNLPLNIVSQSGRFCFVQGSEEEEEEGEATTTTSTDDSFETDTDEPENNSTQGIATSQLAADGNRRKSSGGTSSPLTYRIPSGTTPATNTSSNRSARKASTRRTTPSTQESRGGNPSGTTTLVPDSGSSPARVIVSPETVSIASGDLIVLDPRTINDGVTVEGDYTYDLTSTIGSTVSEDGQFIAGINTSSTDIEETIEVTDTANGNAKALVIIIVAARKQPSSECQLSISPSFAKLSPGKSMQFRAHNSDNGCSEGLYEWKVNSTIGSSINAEGLYTAGKNRDIKPALDIIMVTDTVNAMSTDAIISVLVEPDVPNRASDPISSQPAGAGGKKTYPKILIVLTLLTIVGGIIVIRKFKQ